MSYLREVTFAPYDLRGIILANPLNLNQGNTDMHLLNSMRVSVNRLETLEAIKKNAESHAKIVAEAREGYMKAAEKALAARLKELRTGKLVSLSFNLAPPVDQSKVYRTIIKMLEMHQGETVDLDSSQVRSFVMDEWDWKRQFLLSNAAYSATALEAIGASNGED